MECMSITELTAVSPSKVTVVPRSSMPAAGHEALVILSCWLAGMAKCVATGPGSAAATVSTSITLSALLAAEMTAPERGDGLVLEWVLLLLAQLRVVFFTETRRLVNDMTSSVVELSFRTCTQVHGMQALVK
jgi:hypothetical protein